MAVSAQLFSGGVTTMGGMRVTSAAARSRDERPMRLAAAEGFPRDSRLADGSPTLQTPTADVSRLWSLGILGVPLVQYLRWADDVGAFTALADGVVVSREEILSRTSLNARGVEALFGVLCGLQIAERRSSGYVL